MTSNPWKWNRKLWKTEKNWNLFRSQEPFFCFYIVIFKRDLKIRSNETQSNYYGFSGAIIVQSTLLSWWSCGISPFGDEKTGSRVKSKMARERASSAIPLTEDTLFVGPRIPDEIRRMIPHLTSIDKALFRKILQGMLPLKWWSPAQTTAPAHSDRSPWNWNIFLSPSASFLCWFEKCQWSCMH